jgi:hypothetical protein
MANRFDSAGVSAVLGRTDSEPGERRIDRKRSQVAKSEEHFSNALAGPPSGALGQYAGTPPISKARKQYATEAKSGGGDLSRKVA